MRHPARLRRTLLPVAVAGLILVLAGARSTVGTSDDDPEAASSGEAVTEPVDSAPPPSYGKVVGSPGTAAKVAGQGPAPTTTAAAPPPARPRAVTSVPTTEPPVQRPAEAAPPVSTTVPPTTAPTASGRRCIVYLHGKGSSGAPTYTDGNDVAVVSPTGNSAAWGGRQWLYFPDSGYTAARGIVQQAIDAAGCGAVIVDGFSNGGAFAAKLYCRGETFGGRLVGVIADDPVPDNAVAGCGPPRGVKFALYWTGSLEGTAQPGWVCASADWTCEGGTTLGIDAYQSAIGVTRKASPYSSHQWYRDAPELSSWW